MKRSVRTSCASYNKYPRIISAALQGPIDVEDLEKWGLRKRSERAKYTSHPLMEVDKGCVLAWCAPTAADLPHDVVRGLQRKTTEHLAMDAQK
jgi:hypothetical protein